MRAARAGPVLRGQRFTNEQILRDPALAARKGPGLFARLDFCSSLLTSTARHNWKLRKGFASATLCLSLM